MFTHTRPGTTLLGAIHAECMPLDTGLLIRGPQCGTELPPIVTLLHGRSERACIVLGTLAGPVMPQSLTGGTLPTQLLVPGMLGVG